MNNCQGSALDTKQKQNFEEDTTEWSVTFYIFVWFLYCIND